jgi:hypothetical protein
VGYCNIVGEVSGGENQTQFQQKQGVPELFRLHPISLSSSSKSLIIYCEPNDLEL